MREYLQARDTVKMAITILLNGVKSNIAKKQTDGSLQLEPNPILIRYLNPRCQRKKSTARIADALSLTFEYFVTSADKPEGIYFRAILFVYAISGIDLSYWYGGLTSTNHKTALEYREKLLTLVKNLFRAFNNKEKVAAAEIRNLAYEAAFGTTWLIDPGKLEIPMNIYMNFSNGWNTYLSLSETKKRRLPNAEKCIKQKIDWTISFIFDLFDSKTPADFIEKQPDAGSHISLTSVDTEKDKWKVRFLHTIDTPFGFELLKWVVDLSAILRHTNQYDELSAWVRNYDLMLKEKRLQFASGRIRITRADKLLLEDRLFLKMQKILTGMSQYISLQFRVNTELGIFGSNRCRHDLQLPQPVRNYRQLISSMLAFLFRGNETKSAREGRDEEVKEFKSNVIRRYLKHPDAKFTYKIVDALNYRVQYYLCPDTPEEPCARPLTPAQFGELLWQFMYYSFQIDFYMLRMDGSDDQKQIKDWCALIDAVLNKMVALESLSDSDKMRGLEKMLQKKYQHLQIAYHKTQPIRLSPDEIESFRTLDARAYDNSQALIQHEKHGREDKKAIEMAFKIASLICKTKFENVIEYIKKTLDFLECLLKAQQPEDIHSEYSIAGQDIIIAGNNSKYNYYISMKKIDGERYAIPTDELAELDHYIGIAIALNRCNFARIDIKWIKNNLLSAIKEMDSLASKNYGDELDDTVTSSARKRMNDTNAELFDCEEIANLRKTLDQSYKYILYSEWLDRNMHLTI